MSDTKLFILLLIQEVVLQLLYRTVGMVVSLFFMIVLLVCVSNCFNHEISASSLDSADRAYLDGNKVYKEGNAESAIEYYKLSIQLNPKHFYGG